MTLAITAIGPWKSHLEPPRIIGISDINISHNKSAGKEQIYYFLNINFKCAGFYEQEFLWPIKETTPQLFPPLVSPDNPIGVLINLIKTHTSIIQSRFRLPE